MKIFQYSRSDKIANVSIYKKHKPQNHEIYAKYGIILNVCFWAGINISEKAKTRNLVRHVLSFLFPVLMHLAYIDYLIMSYKNLKRMWHEYQVVISYVTSNTLSLCLWHILYSRRKKLKTFLVKLASVSDVILVNKPRKKKLTNFAIFSVIVFLPIFYSCLTVFLINHNDKDHYHRFFTYGKTVENFTFTVNAYLFVKTLFSEMLDPVFTSIVTILYCTLCHRCHLLISACKRKLQALNRTRSNPRLLLELTRDYAKTIEMLELLQNVFSLPTFLLVVVDSTSSFTTLASVLLYSSEERTALITAENVFVFANSALLLAATIGFAGQIPITMNEISSRSQRLYDTALWESNNGARDRIEVLLLDVIQRKKVFVLSGCDIIVFTRGAILTALGTLFTYGLLIIQNR